MNPPITPQEHTCALTAREPSTCDLCMRFEVELWDAINAYATSVGGDPSKHVYGNTSRYHAVAAVARVVDQAALRRRIDDVTIGELAKGCDAAAGRACKLTADYAHLQRLYAESYNYVGTLERERDELVEVLRRNGTEIDRLETEAEALRRQVGR